MTEQSVLFDIEDFSVSRGLASLIASYYVYDIGYPKSFAACNFLLFIQEHLLEIREKKTKHSVRYNEFVNSVVHCDT